MFFVTYSVIPQVLTLFEFSSIDVHWRNGGFDAIIASNFKCKGTAFRFFGDIIHLNHLVNDVLSKWLTAIFLTISNLPRHLQYLSFTILKTMPLTPNNFLLTLCGRYVYFNLIGSFHLAFRKSLFKIIGASLVTNSLVTASRACSPILIEIGKQYRGGMTLHHTSPRRSVRASDKVHFDLIL